MPKKTMALSARSNIFPGEGLGISICRCFLWLGLEGGKPVGALGKNPSEKWWSSSMTGWWPKPNISGKMPKSWHKMATSYHQPENLAEYLAPFNRETSSQYLSFCQICQRRKTLEDQQCQHVGRFHSENLQVTSYELTIADMSWVHHGPLWPGFAPSLKPLSQHVCLLSLLLT